MKVILVNSELVFATAKLLKIVAQKDEMYLDNDGNIVSQASYVADIYKLSNVEAGDILKVSGNTYTSAKKGVFAVYSAQSVEKIGASTLVYEKKGEGSSTTLQTFDESYIITSNDVYVVVARYNKETNVPLEDQLKAVCRKRSIPTHSERLNPPTIIAKMALKSA